MTNCSLKTPILSKVVETLAIQRCPDAMASGYFSLCCFFFFNPSHTSRESITWNASFFLLLKWYICPLVSNMQWTWRALLMNPGMNNIVKEREKGGESLRPVLLLRRKETPQELTLGEWRQSMILFQLNVARFRLKFFQDIVSLLPIDHFSSNGWLALCQIRFQGSSASDKEGVIVVLHA